MSAELRKLLALPTPRWTLVATVASVALAALVAGLAGTGRGEDLLAVQLGVGLTTSVASIVLGAWMIGLEYGQRTVRRALTANPSRPRLVLAKLAVALSCVAVVTVLLFAISAPAMSAIASSQGESMPIRASLEFGLATLLSNLIYATVSFGLALATRSMAGGMALALAFAFVVDSGLSLIPTVGDYSLSAAVLELMAAISGDELDGVEGDPNVGQALAVTASWVIAIVGVSVTRFVRSDVEH